MKQFVYALLLMLSIVSVTMINDSPAIERPLRTEEVKAVDPTETFTLIFYGGRYHDDFETVAILDVEGDEYTFEPYAPEFDYRVKRGVPAKDALKEAEQFVSRHPDFSRSLLSRIPDNNGKTIGYELRPLYHPLTLGISDVLDIDYWIKNGKVKVTVKLKPMIEMKLFGGDGSKGKGDGH